MRSPQCRYLSRAVSLCLLHPGELATNDWCISYNIYFSIVDFPELSILCLRLNEVVIVPMFSIFCFHSLYICQKETLDFIPIGQPKGVTILDICCFTHKIFGSFL